MWKSKKGSVLIVLIITMTIMAVLGAAMAIFLASSSLTELYLNQANQAQYLAESGMRFGYSSPLFTFPTTPYSLANVPGQISISKTVNNFIISTGIINSGTQNQRRTIKWGPGSGTNGGGRPPHNIAALSASTATSTTLLSSLDTSGIVPGQVATLNGNAANGCGGATETFVMFQNTTLIADPDTSCNIGSHCQIGYLVVPLTTASVAPLQTIWSAYGRVSYDVQVKVGWMATSPDAAQGINVRWHVSATPGKYEGYGISFIEYRSRIACASDWVPCNIKPCIGNPCGSDNTLATRLMLVLWQQKVVGGIETKTWLAYALLGDPANPLPSPITGDPKVLGAQNANDGLYVNDNASLVIRIEDKISFTGIRYNDIKIYYGENSNVVARTQVPLPNGTRTPDAAATNINRAAYAPNCNAATWTPSWPSNIYEPYTDTPPTLTYWSYSGWWANTPYLANNIVIPDYRTASDGLTHNYKCTVAGTSGTFEPISWPASGTVTDGSVTWQENGTARPTSYDYFTIGSVNPVIATNTVRLVVNSAVVNDVNTNNLPAATVMLLSDRATIRTYDFTLDTFPTTRPEVALHAMGNLTSTSNVGFNDLAIQILGRAE